MEQKSWRLVYTKPGEVQVQDIPDPKFENPQGRKIGHAVIPESRINQYLRIRSAILFAAA